MEPSTAANPSELSQPQVNKDKTPGSGSQRENGGVYERSALCVTKSHVHGFILLSYSLKTEGFRHTRLTAQFRGC